MDISQGWLSIANRLPSPNYNQRPLGVEINLLVIHNISLPPGKFEGKWIDDLFLNQIDPEAHPSFSSLAGLRVSAHLLIRRDGSVHQYVPFNLRAWHAGVSSFEGVENCNDYAIGIELEGADHVPYQLEQYNMLIEITKSLMVTYPISPNRIVGHSQIAPGRKTDPGPAFDWQHYLGGLDGAYSSFS